MPYEVHIKDKEKEIHEIIQELKELKRLIEEIKGREYEVYVKRLKI